MTKDRKYMRFQVISHYFCTAYNSYNVKTGLYSVG